MSDETDIVSIDEPTGTPEPAEVAAGIVAIEQPSDEGARTEAPSDIAGLVPITAAPSGRVAAATYRGLLITAVLLDSPVKNGGDDYPGSEYDHHFSVRITTQWGQRDAERYASRRALGLDANVRQLFERAIERIDAGYAYTGDGGAALSDVAVELVLVRRHLAGQPYAD